MEKLVRTEEKASTIVDEMGGGTFGTSRREKKAYLRTERRYWMGIVRRVEGNLHKVRRAIDQFREF